MPSFGYEILATAGATFAAIDRGLTRAQTAGRQALSGLLIEALSVEEHSDFGVRIYERVLRRDQTSRGLFPWERAWYEQRLPPAPARILLGAAGSGREAKALAEIGYHVDAFEPGRRAAALCREAIGNRGRALVGRYEELTAAVLDDVGTSLEPIAHERYDAVILGWGSFSHILDTAEQLRVLQAAARLSPTGPILASFWLKRPQTPTSRALGVGRAVGRSIAGLRGGQRPDAPLDAAAWTLIFAHSYRRERIEELAQAIRRIAIWRERDELGEQNYNYPHATFVVGS